MKNFVLLFLTTFLSFPTFANAQFTTYKNVTLHICDDELVGCADKITINDKDYLVDIKDTAVRKKYMEVSTNLRRHKKLQTKLAYIKGSTIKEKGHFPNPTAEFDVIKLHDIKHMETK